MSAAVLRLGPWRRSVIGQIKPITRRCTPRVKAFTSVVMVTAVLVSPPPSFAAKSSARSINETCTVAENDKEADNNEIDSLREKAWNLFKTGDSEAAAEIMASVVAKTGALFGHRHISKGRDLNDRAQMLTAAKNYKEAEILLSEAISIAECYYKSVTTPTQPPSQPNHAPCLMQRTYSRAPPAPADTHASECVSYHSNDVPSEAEEPDDDVIVEASVTLAGTLNNFALVEMELGRHEAAENAWRRALSVAEAAADELELATWENNLGRLLSMRGKHYEALEMFKSAEWRQSGALGTNHLDTLATAEWIATIHLKLGELCEAERVLWSVLDGLTIELGPTHATTRRVARNLSGILLQRAAYDEAEPLLMMLIDVEEDGSGGHDFCEIAVTLETLAGILIDQNRLREAAPLYARLLSTARRTATTATTTMTTATQITSESTSTRMTSTDLNNTVTTTIHSPTTTTISVTGPHPAAAAARYTAGAASLANALKRKGHYAEAEVLLRECIELTTALAGGGGDGHHLFMNSLAALLKAQGRFDEAEELLSQIGQIVLPGFNRK